MLTPVSLIRSLIEQRRRQLKLNSIADKIHDALTKGDFKAAGKAVGEAVNEAFSWLRNVAGWDKNAKKITKTVGNLIDFINGVATSFNGADAGTAIGDVVNSIIESLKMFTDPSAGIDFDLIGTRVGEMIKGAVDKIKWTDLGIAIVQGIQAAVRYVKWHCGCTRLLGFSRYGCKRWDHRNGHRFRPGGVVNCSH